MKEYFFKQFKAVGMRHQGHSYTEIQKATNVPLSTLSRWLSCLRLNDQAKSLILERKEAANLKARQRSWTKSRNLKGLSS